MRCKKKEREAKAMVRFSTYYYEFADGYYFYSYGRTDRNEIKWNELKHGKLVTEKCLTH